MCKRETIAKIHILDKHKTGMNFLTRTDGQIRSGRNLKYRFLVCQTPERGKSQILFFLLQSSRTYIDIMLHVYCSPKS